MEWSQVIVMLIGMIGLFAWNRAEGRADNRQLMSLIKEIQNEMKDFHGRLCAIEERRKKN